MRGSRADPGDGGLGCSPSGREIKAQTQSFHTGSFLALQASETPRGVPEVKAILVVVNTSAQGNFQDPAGDNVIALMADGMCALLKLNF